MAIAGLQSVSMLESAILRDSRSSSYEGNDSQRRSGTRASSILQMWQDLEDECVVSHADERVRSRVQHQSSDGLSTGAMTSNLSQIQENESRGGLEDLDVSENGDGTTSNGQIGPQSEHEDHQSTNSEQSDKFGEVERERVRQIVQEWMNCGVTGCSSNVSSVSSFPSPRSQWLCEPELERVRVVREWIQMTSHRRDARGEQVTEIESQIEQVRDGLFLHHNEGQPDSTRSNIRKLCGRQALLDLLAKKEQERQSEFQALMESRPVTSFAFRNRIQSLLRIRLLQSKTLVEHSRPNSATAGELGLLWQRHTVSGIREGFLSGLHINSHGQASELSDSSYSSGANGFRDNQMEANNSTNVLDDAHVQIGSVNQGGDIGASLDCTLDLVASTIDEERNLEVSTRTQVETRLEHAFDNDSVSIEESAIDEFDQRNVPGADNESWQIICQESSEHESGNGSGFAGSTEILDDQYDLHTEEREVPDITSQLDNSASNGSDHVNDQESTTQVEDLLEVTGDDEREWGGGILTNEWEDGALEEMDGRNLAGTGHELSYSSQGNEGREQSHLREAYWNENGSQEETMGDWLEGHSASVVASAASVDPYYYYSDDDNSYNTELRELLNRRRVSNLLHSGFRESLDQLIQAYVERRSQSPEGWELQEILPPLAMQDEEQLSTTQNEELSTVEGSRPIQPSTTVAPQQHWDQELPQRAWSRQSMRQHPGTELEVINDLRMDIARLQQRLNNMQRMLEACMDVQLELQRTVRQEVSAALNRSISSSGAVEDAILRDGSKWDSVRKGLCCVCCDSNIDSLLYRCGHMCTCTKCANMLVEGNGKCPMCQAPVIELVHAYTIQ